MKFDSGLDKDSLDYIKDYLGDEDEMIELVKGEWKPEEIEGYDPRSTILGKQRRVR